MSFSCVHYFNFSPTGRLEEYLGCMARIQKAVEYFQDNNPDSPELNRVVCNVLENQGHCVGICFSDIGSILASSGKVRFVCRSILLGSRFDLLARIMLYLLTVSFPSILYQ